MNTLNNRVIRLISMGVNQEELFFELSAESIKNSTDRLRIIRYCDKCLMGKHGQSDNIEYWYYKYNGILYGFYMNASTQKIYGLHLL